MNMFGKNNSKDTAAKPEAAANSNGTAAATPPAEEKGFKDRPRPVSIFRAEAAKTTAAKQQTAEERAVVDTQLKGLLDKYTPTLEAHDKQLTAAGEARIKVRRETVEGLTQEVGASKQLIAELEKRLQEERAKLARSENSLYTASRELKDESGKIAKEHKAAMKAKKQELGEKISAARKERSAVYSTTGKKMRSERWHTFARTTREGLAVVPDLTMRFLKAAGRGISEMKAVFGRSARSAKKGFDEPTLFSIRREEPVTPPKKEPKPKAPQPQQP